MFKPIYFFHGENEFEMNKKIHGISEKHNLTERIIPEGTGFPEIIMNLNTPSLFEGEILYIVRDDGILRDDEGLDVLKNYINNPSPFACLILAFPKKVWYEKENT